MTTDYRTICAELLKAWDDLPWEYDISPLAKIDNTPFERARLALAQPEPPQPEPTVWSAINAMAERIANLETAISAARLALAQSEPVEPMMINCRWDGPSPEPHASVSDWFEQEGSKGLLCGLRISALPSRGGARFAKQAAWLTNEKLSELMHDFVLGGESPDDFSFDHIGYAKAVMKACGIPEPQAR